MNSKLDSKLNMYRSVQKLCNDKKALISGNAAFLDAFSSFSAKIDEIINTASSSTGVIKGIAIDKSVAKKNLCQTGADVAAIIFAYASTTRNNTLKQAVNFSFSDLTRQKGDTLVPVCMNIYNAANENNTALLPYGLTTDMIKALSASMKNYSDASPNTKTAKAVKRTYKRNLKLLITDTDAILKDQMDKILNTFKTTDADFVSSYKNTRVIIDPRRTKRKPPVTSASDTLTTG